MNEHTDPEFEGQVRDLLAAPQADPAFMSSLRYRLMTSTERKPLRRWLIGLAWAAAVRAGFARHGVAALFPAGRPGHEAPAGVHPRCGLC